MTKSGVKVIEFNVRMGDPETQVVLPQLVSDFGTTILNLLDNKLTDVKWQHGNYYLGSVVVSKGYPSNPIDGKQLPKINLNSDLLISYAGTALSKQNSVLSSGGRIMMVTSKDASLSGAQNKVNNYLQSCINLDDYYYRHDIGQKGIDYINN